MPSRPLVCHGRPVSEQGVEIVRGIYDRWREGNFRAPTEVFDPDVLFILRPGFPDAGRYLGVERLADYTRGFLEPWHRLTIEAEELIGAGDSVVAAVRQTAAGTGSGVSTEFRYFQLWSLRGGWVIRFENVRERCEALEAVGLLRPADTLGSIAEGSSKYP